MSAAVAGLFLLLVAHMTAAAGNASPLTVDGKSLGDQIYVHDLTINTNLTLTISSASAGDVAPVRVGGLVTLNGTLTINAIGAPFPLGRTYILIENDGVEAIIGTFTGLPEGTIFEAGGQLFRISYVGGTGNDVVLTAVAATPIPTLEGLALLVLAGLLGVAAVVALKAS